MDNIRVSQNQLDFSFSTMILSASGWRKVFAVSGNEQDGCAGISDADKVLCTAIALVFHSSLNLSDKSRILVARDARPTGNVICDIITRTLKGLGCNVGYAGICSAPETMALSAVEKWDGFVYVSASHNPIGHNGIKFGKDGGVFGQSVINPIINSLKQAVCDVEKLNDIYNRFAEVKVDVDSDLKAKSLDVYKRFVELTTCPDGNICSFKDSIAEVPGGIGIVADLNGSARCYSIDKEFFKSIGIKSCFVNDRVTEDIVHGIIPEGTNLETVRRLLEKQHSVDPSYVVGYMPDNDGDRGNIVYIDSDGKAKMLEAQEVFALCVSSTIGYHCNKGAKNLAVAVNGPTSMRVNDICNLFNAKVFRAEVGEANVVGLADSLRSRGYSVPILGEGSNGGNITYPARVRDPLNTLMCIVRLLTNSKPLYCSVNALPEYITTNTGDDVAILHLKTKDYKNLKAAYERNFTCQWNEKKIFLYNFGIESWFETQTEGTVERYETGNGNTGGLKICFTDKNKSAVAFIWMRPSGTEPLFRVMADVKGKNRELHDFLINWQREMILKAQEEITG